MAIFGDFRFKSSGHTVKYYSSLGYNCRSFWRKKSFFIFKFKSVTRFGCKFSPKIANFGVLDQFLVILNLNHLATPRKWPKSLNYQIFTESPDLDQNIPKNRQFGVFDQFLVKKKSETSGDAVKTEHRTPGRPVICGQIILSVIILSLCAYTSAL